MKRMRRDEIMANNMDKRAKQILDYAKEMGVKDNFFFATTFERYLNQIKNIQRLADALDDCEEITVTKSYQKNRDNVYINPLITQFDRTTDSANKTVSTLMRIIKTFGVGDNSEESDPLMELLNDE